MIGNEVADLTQQREPTLRWLLFSAFCFHNRALWHGPSQKPMLFSPETPSAYGMAVFIFQPIFVTGRRSSTPQPQTARTITTITPNRVAGTIALPDHLDRK